MFPRIHIIWGAIFSIILYFLFPESIGLLGASVIFLSSILIDVDHYTYYVYKTKNWNLKKSIQWYFINNDKFKKMSSAQKDRIYTGLCFLHGTEALLLLFILVIIPSPLSIWALFVSIGFIFHLIVDAIDLYIRNYRFEKVISFIYSLKKSKNRKLLQDLK